MGSRVAVVTILLLVGIVGCGKTAPETQSNATASTQSAEKSAAAQPETTPKAPPAKQESTPASNPTSPTQGATPTPVSRSSESEAPSGAPASSGSKAVGSASAPITIEVFSDYQCPACRELYLETLRPLIDNYVLTGKVYLIHRDMPLTVHQYSRLAARYGDAAAHVNELEKVSTALFLNQMQWSIDGNVDRVVAQVLTPAEMRQVRQLVESGKMDAAIDSDVERARTFSVRQTPTMVITHKGRSDPVVGVIPYSMLRQYLDELLKK